MENKRVVGIRSEGIHAELSWREFWNHPKDDRNVYAIPQFHDELMKFFTDTKLRG